MPNLPTVSAKITGDASGLISELKRAETATTLSGAKLEADIGNAMNRIERRFSLAHFGTDFLKGIGMGTGFQLLEKGAEMMASYWKEAAESAKTVADESERQLTATLATIAAHSTDAQKLTTMLAQRASMEKQLAALNAPQFETRTVGVGMGMTTTETVALEKTNAQMEASAKLATDLQVLGNQIDATNKKIVDSAKKVADADLAGTLKIAAAEGVKYNNIKEITADDEARAANEVRGFADALAKEVEHYKELGDPMTKYRQELERINQLEAEGALTGMQAAQAKVGLMGHNGQLTPNRAMMDAQSMEGFDASYDKAVLKTHELTDAQKQLADSLGRTFADAIMSGEKFGDVLKSLAADFLHMMLQKEATSAFGSIIGKSGNLGDGLAAWLYGYAGGGDPPVGVPAIVGENGPEIFVPKTAGTIVTNSAMRGMAAGGGGGNYYIDARGADRTGLARLEAMIRSVQGSIKPTSMSAFADNRRRSAAA